MPSPAVSWKTSVISAWKSLAPAAAASSAYSGGAAAAASSAALTAPAKWQAASAFASFSTASVNSVSGALRNLSAISIPLVLDWASLGDMYLVDLGLAVGSTKDSASASGLSLRLFSSFSAFLSNLFLSRHGKQSSVL